MTRSITAIPICVALLCSSALAGVKSQSIREAAEYVIEKFGAEATEETVETLSRKITKCVAKYGEDAVPAIRKVGPRAFQLLDDAGENAPAVLRLLNRYGNGGVWVASRPGNLAIFVKYGEPAAEAMIKHPGLAEPIVEEFGASGASALRIISGQNARRLTMMQSDRALAEIGRSDKLLDIVGKYGDPAMDFIWRNKASLTVAAGLTAFLTNPEPFINGTADITKYVSENAIKPIASVPGEIAIEAARNTNWTVIVSIAILVTAGIVGVWIWLRYRPRVAAAPINKGTR